MRTLLGPNQTAVTVFSSLQVKEDGFAFDPTTGDSYLLNPTGQEVLRLLQQGHSPHKIAITLVQTLGVAQGIAERDVTDFVQQLTLLGVIGVNR
ncbi:hypothetical protein BST81_03590 [Leptolyngbya sp. 'hensonii']|uniref:PqqD family protein n=1 Tax=Leptolyngbya sp. 'hensonii' TaxID=1922337 RepID=UPI00094F7FA5|nr:PqqD family protein [Leptolyngbya sp. 'hensonii']OLP19639.1 hypothetical protein BST81_03590 [Leptolyngbya sp. 'hensonii']